MSIILTIVSFTILATLLGWFGWKAFTKTPVCGVTVHDCPDGWAIVLDDIAPPRWGHRHYEEVTVSTVAPSSDDDDEDDDDYW